MVIARATSSAAANASGSPGVTRQPVTPCTTVSTGPPKSAAMTGRAIAWASITTRPKASAWVDACTTTSDSSIAAGMSSHCPTSRTRSPMPSAIASFISRDV